jgi:hypothetical protein
LSDFCLALNTFSPLSYLILTQGSSSKQYEFSQLGRHIIWQFFRTVVLIEDQYVVGSNTKIEFIAS